MVQCGLQDASKLRRGIKADSIVGNFPEVSILFGFANFAHFLGTFSNHACRCHFGHVADAAGMYSILFFVAIYKAWRAFSAHRDVSAVVPIRYLFPLYALGTMMLVVYADIYYCPACEHREALGVGGLIVAGLVSSAAQRVSFSRHHAGKRLNKNTFIGNYGLLLAPPVFIVGLVSHTADRHGVWCDPQHPFQGHALWHICGAVGIALVYLDMRSENAAHYENKAR